MSGTTETNSAPPATVPDGPQGEFTTAPNEDFAEIMQAWGDTPAPPPAQPAQEASTPQTPAAAPTGGEAVVAAPASPPPVEAPVAPPASPTTPSPQPSSEAPAPAALPTATPAEQTPEIPPALVVASLQAQVQTLQQQLAEAAKGAPAPTTAPAAAGSDSSETPAHNLSVPQEVVAALFDEEPVKAQHALNHIINGLANYMHKKLREEFTGTLSTSIASLRNEIATSSTASTAEQQREEQQRAYYTAFPAHNNPALTPIVAQTAAEVLTEVPNAPWSPELIAAIGARVNHKMQQLGVSLASPAPSAQPVVAAMLPTSAPAAPVGSTPEDEIASTFRL